MFRRVLSAWVIMLACCAPHADRLEQALLSEFALLSDAEFAELASGHQGNIHEQRPLLERCIGVELARRIPGSSYRTWGWGALWMTARQRLELCRDGRASSMQFMDDLWSLRGPYRAEIEFVAKRREASWSVAQSGHYPEFGPLVELSRADVPDAEALYFLVEYGSVRGWQSTGNREYWPNDLGSAVCRFAQREPEYITALLREAVVESYADSLPNSSIPYWSVLALVRMGRWDEDLLKQRRKEWSWHFARAWFGQGDDDAVWTSFKATLEGRLAQSRVVERLLRQGNGYKEVVGYWLALTNDRSSSPEGLIESRPFSSKTYDVPDWWGRIPLSAKLQLLEGQNGDLLTAWVAMRGKEESYRFPGMRLRGGLRTQAYSTLARLADESVAALFVLAAAGYQQYCDRLFWGVAEGVFASGMSLDGYLGWAAWDAGYMVRLLRHALEHGGAYLDLAKLWVGADAMDLDTDSDGKDTYTDEFERRLAWMLAGDTVVGRWSPLCRAWYITRSK